MTTSSKLQRPTRRRHRRLEQADLFTAAGEAGLTHRFGRPESHVAYCWRTPAGGWSHRFLPKAHLDAYLAAPPGRADRAEEFLSVAEFKGRRRTVGTLDRVGVCFADLDLAALAALDAGPRADYIRRAIIDHGLPRPSVQVFTGRGVHVKWLLSGPVEADRLPGWSATERALAARLQALAADLKVTDAARVLRLVDSWHPSGNQCTVDALDRTDAGLVRRYELQALAAAADVDLAPLAPAAVEQSPELPAAPWPEPGEEVSGQVRAARAAEWTKFQDLQRLAYLRGGIEAGRRELWLHASLACLLLSGSVPWRNWEREARALASQCRDFERGQDWHLADLYTTARKAKERTGYRYGRQTLLDLFGIDPAEQRELTYLTGQAERARRARAPKKLRNAAFALRKEGVSVREIARRLDLPKSVVGRLFVSREI